MRCSANQTIRCLEMKQPSGSVLISRQTHGSWRTGIASEREAASLPLVDEGVESAGSKLDSGQLGLPVRSGRELLLA